MLEELKGRLADFLSKQWIFGLLVFAAATYLICIGKIGESTWATVSLGLAGFVFGATAVTKYLGYDAAVADAEKKRCGK